MNIKTYKVLLVEGVLADAERVERALKEGGFNFVSKCVVTKDAFCKALEAFVPDIILSDYRLGRFSGLSALSIVKEKCPSTPFIFVTESVGDELAVETLKQGATDYILKNKLKTLVPAVERALHNVSSLAKEKEIDRTKIEFVSLASHQLRTPLTAISWYTEMILRGDVGQITPGQRKYLEEIYHGDTRMVELINTLLDVSRLELGTFRAEPRPIDIIALARSVLDEQKPNSEKKKLTIIKHLSTDISSILADPKLLRMVFQNLLTNAVDYTPEGGKVEFSLALDRAKKSILLVVSDNGYGIPRSQQDKIFIKFFRADNAGSQNADGTGLGLFIVKSIVESFGGTIRFESEEHQGTVFYVTLPLTGMGKKEHIPLAAH